MTASPTLLRPAARLGAVRAYAPPLSRARMADDVLRLDRNEGIAPSLPASSGALALAGEVLCRYPSTAALEAQLADRLAVDPACVIVTGGADDAIARACQIVLEPGRRAITVAPTFEMIPHDVRLSGADVTSVPWLDGEFPAEAICDAIAPDVSAVLIDTPNNPTGAEAPADALLRIARCAEHALTVVDLAYVEFADDDPTSQLIERPNVLMTRTFSKAWGIAGLRLGYAVGDPRVIEWMRAVGSPYPATGPALAIASALLESGDEPAYVDRARVERDQLTALLEECGLEVVPSSANYVFVRVPDAWQVADALAAEGVLVRRFDESGPIGDRLRITCPGDDGAFDRLCTAIRTCTSGREVRQ